MSLVMKIFSRVARITAILAAVFAMAGCNLTYTPEPLVRNGYISLYFDVPATKAADTADYSDPDNREGADNMLAATDIDVWFFSTSGSFVYKASGFDEITLIPDTDISYNPHYHRFIAQISVDRLINGTTYRVVVVANRRPSISGLPFVVPQFELNQGVGSTDEEKLYSLLRFGYYNASDASGIEIQRYAERNLKGEDDSRVPMWGFRQMPAKILFASDLDSNPPTEAIDLVRSVAKVRVQISSELANFVNVTGMTLKTRSIDGFMSPAYSKVKDITASPDMLGKDVSAGQYTDDWINAGAQTQAAEVYVTVPFYKSPDNGAYYAYLPESTIGNAHIEMSFNWKDPALNGVTIDKTLQFADYEKATAALLGGKDIPLTDDQLLPYRFPVMRNHYYIYTITKLDPLELKFEVCEWKQKSTSISFN